MSKSRKKKATHQKKQKEFRAAERRRLSRRRAAWCILVSLLILATLVVIFLLSAEGKEESGGRSGRVTGWLVDLFTGGRLSAADRAAAIRRLGRMVRKLAHMAEYAVLTAECTVLAVILRPTRRKDSRVWAEWILPFAVCLVYAASDEIHQIFSGRGPAVTDVLIDCAGGLIGLGLTHLVVLLITKRRTRRKDRRKESHHADKSRKPARR